MSIHVYTATVRVCMQPESCVYPAGRSRRAGRESLIRRHCVSVVLGMVSRKDIHHQRYSSGQCSIAPTQKQEPIAIACI